MGRTIQILSVLLLTWAYTQAQIDSNTNSIAETTETVDSTETTETTEYGPINMVVDQLSNMAVNISDQTSTQLQANIERTLTSILDDLEELTTNAMAEMSIAIDDTNQVLLGNPECNAAWNLQDFTLNVTDELRGCTEQLSNMIATYRGEGQQALANVQSFVQQMAQLPIVCQSQQMGVALAPMGISFDNSNSCFLRGIAVINQGLAEAMHNASLLLVRTRRLAQNELARSQQCSNALVAQVTEYLRVQRANCS
ncbi:uncharacterized protein LOC6572724 [Drosophila mojavensis]|uniref:Protein TsetseEP domain-containing protein n=1 Tax=Drosophila mojavensis TaxID=7230 RepID=B4K7V7_DROMO|nr:uncharacterized protein LOC6572724 [Drosophila mojavensis]EDW14291.1 uncharacterized protein Dmoj_GI23415 [Drosophila mojavensis]